MMTSTIRGMVFDLDGTLVDSQLDFDQMRREMELPPGVPILETLSELPDDHAQRCREILKRHESAGAERATLLPGVREFLDRLDALGIRRAVFTRNTRGLAHQVLGRLQLAFEDVATRDDGPVKPDPTAIHQFCERWRLTPAEILVVGDYHYDLEAGRRAGARTALYTANRNHHAWPWAAAADLVFHSYHEAEAVLPNGHAPTAE